MGSEQNSALSNIANDALTLRDGWQRSARRCHKAARQVPPNDHDRRADELREYTQIAQQLAVAVAVHIPDVAQRLQILSRDCSRVESVRFAAWPALESDLRAIEVAAIGAINAASTEMPVRAHRESLFPKGQEGIDQDTIDLIVQLDTQRSTKCDVQIAREFFGRRDDPSTEALKALARIRRMRQSGRTSLPPRT